VEKMQVSRLRPKKRGTEKHSTADLITNALAEAKKKHNLDAGWERIR
jgi:hypothetical protein